MKGRIGVNWRCRRGVGSIRHRNGLAPRCSVRYILSGPMSTFVWGAGTDAHFPDFPARSELVKVADLISARRRSFVENGFAVSLPHRDSFLLTVASPRAKTAGCRQRGIRLLRAAGAARGKTL